MKSNYHNYRESLTANSLSWTLRLVHIYMYINQVTKLCTIQTETIIKQTIQEMQATEWNKLTPGQQCLSVFTPTKYSNMTY